MSTSFPNILVTGGNGQLATAMKQHTTGINNIVFCDRSQLDITSIASLEQAIAATKPQIIINTAAFTAVDQAEQHQKDAFLINQVGAKHVAMLCEKQAILLIHLSTDYVFDGEPEENAEKRAYSETDATHPINIYGQSKLAGEEAIREHCENHLILRVSGVFSEFGHNFFKTIVKLAQEKETLQVVDDQLTCPTYAGDIAKTLLMIAKNPAHRGTYHYCSEHTTSWHGFAVQIINTLRQHARVAVKSIQAVSSLDYKTLAKRPYFSVLDCNKIKKDYAISQPSWESAVKRMMT